LWLGAGVSRLTTNAVFTAAEIFSNPHLRLQKAKGGGEMKLAQTHAVPLVITKNG
jgi:hypothetical protein